MFLCRFLLDPRCTCQVEFDCLENSPDFIAVDREGTYWIVEAKMDGEMASDEVQAKQKLVGGPEAPGWVTQLEEATRSRYSAGGRRRCDPADKEWLGDDARSVGSMPPCSTAWFRGRFRMHHRYTRPLCLLEWMSPFPSARRRSSTEASTLPTGSIRYSRAVPASECGVALPASGRYN